MQNMESTLPGIPTAIPGGEPRVSLQAARHPSRWLLELDTDGTIRHSSSHPAGAIDAANFSLIGSNFFDLATVLGDLSELKRNFFGFVKDRGRSSVKANAGITNGAVVVLTRSYDTTWQSRCEVVLMEIRSE